MSYAGITKGFQALATAMALGAARANATDAFLEEIQSTLPELHGWLRKVLPSMPRKAYRWDGEMREIAMFLEPDRSAADMLSAAADFYRRVAADVRSGEEFELGSVIERFTQRNA